MDIITKLLCKPPSRNGFDYDICTFLPKNKWNHETFEVQNYFLKAYWCYDIC